MKTDVAFLDTPRRQHNAAIVLILLRLFTQLLRQFWWVILLYFLGKQGGNGENNFWLYVTLGLGGFSAITSIIAFFRFYFYTENGELVIEKGVFQRNRLTVPFERIQTITFQQGPVHRFFNVVELEIDTAGSQGVEFNITALPRAEAERVRDYLIARRDAVRSELGETPTGEVDAETEAVAADELLLQLSPKDLLKVGVSQNHLRTSLLILAFFFSIFQNISEAVDDVYDNPYETAWDTVRESTWLLALTSVGALLIVAFLITLVTTVVRYFNLRFWRTPTGFRLLGGLINRREQSANLRKVQVIRWQTNPLRRLFKIWTLQLRQAGSVAATRKTSVAVPGCYAHQVSAVRRSYFPEEATLPFGSYEIEPDYIWRRTLYLGIYPALIGVALAIFVWHSLWMGIFFAALLPAQYFWARAFRRRFRYQLSTDGMRLKSGVIAETWQLLRWAKVQSVEIRQGRYQQRKDLATVTLSTAAGKLRLPYISLDRARQLQDFVTYRVETARGSWM